MGIYANMYCVTLTRTHKVFNEEIGIISGYALLVKINKRVYIYIGPEMLCFLIMASKQFVHRLIKWIKIKLN